MEKDILLDVANETARRYDGLAPDFADKMLKRVRRKFSVKVEPQEISELALHYKEIYKFANSVLKEYLDPPKGKFARPDDVAIDKFLERLKKEFPEDDRDVLYKISCWVIYFEYLR